MIKVVVICEYNPLHNGHLRQLEFIRSRFGENATVTALMSGNFVQRGELACAPKYARAASAVKSGCDLVLELPFPWSCSSAGFFARAGVSLIKSLGVFDALCFGCESIVEPVGTTNSALLYTPAEQETLARFREYLSCRGQTELGVQPERSAHRSKLRAAEAVYREKYGPEIFFPNSPNDILAAEYIEAIDSCAADCGRNIKPYPLPRIRGLSATASRAAWERGDFTALKRLVPAATAELCEEAGAPFSIERLGITLPMFFRLADPSELIKYCDAEGGLAERLCGASQTSLSSSELFAQAAAKNFTSARIRRAALHCLFGTSYAEVEAAPPYTLLLAANPRGTALLREIKKLSSVPVVTKPADHRTLGSEAVRAFERCARADNVYMLAYGERGDPIKQSPFIADNF